MRWLAALFGVFCGAVVAAHYGFKTSDNDFDGSIRAFMFGAVSFGGLFGHVLGVVRSAVNELIATLAQRSGLAKMAKSLRQPGGHEMKSLSAKDAKYGFGRMIDLARAAPVMIEKHGRPVVVVMALEEFERLKGLEHHAAGLGGPIKKSLTAKKAG